MYIAVVSLEVDDVDRAIAFYTEKLGWDKTADVPMGPDMRWVTLAPIGEKTAFTLQKREKPLDPEDRFAGVVLEVADVHAAYELLAKEGVRFAEPPRNEPWGGWASFEDSEGNVIGVHSPAHGGANAN